MPYVYSQTGLRQSAPVARAAAAPARSPVRRKQKRKSPATAVIWTKEKVDEFAADWASEMTIWEITEKWGYSNPGGPSIAAKRLGLPRRTVKATTRKRDRLLTEGLAAGMGWDAVAEHAGFPHAESARRRARAIGVGAVTTGGSAP